MYIKTGSGSGATSSNWKNAAQMYIKTSASVWERIRQGYIKTGSGSGSISTNWKRFFYEANLPTVTTYPEIRSANTSGTGGIYDGVAADSPQFLNVDLFGKDGTYANYTSIPAASRRFSYADNLDDTTRTTLVNDDRFSSAGGVTTANRTAVDGKYLFYEVQVNNGTGDDYINPVSNAIKMIKRQPALDTSFTTTLSGTSAPGQRLTLTYYLKNNYYDKIIPSTSRIKWWRSTDNTASGTLVKEEILTNTIVDNGTSVLTGESFYDIAASADNGYYIVVEIVGVSSWTVHNSYTNGYQIAKRNSSIVQGLYRFAFGNTLYVSSNGHIGLDTSTNASSYTTHSSGRSISIYLKDLTQYYLAEYSDSDVYYLYSKGYLQGTSAAAANALDYQIKFYNNPSINYCDVKMIRYGSNVPASPTATQGFYASGLSGHEGVVGPYFIGAGSIFRVYFDGDPAITNGFTWTDVNDAYWDTIQTWTSPGVDDTFTAVVTAANQSAPVPTTPTALSTSINASNQIVLTYSGGTGNQYDIYFNNSDTRPTDQQAYSDFPGETSPYIATTLTGRGTTRWFWVRKSTGTLRSNWFPAGSGITARLPLFAPPAPVITNSAQAQTTLSWHWTKPATSTTQDQPTSWDYALTDSTTSPTSGWTNTTTLPTAAAPVVTSNLTSGTDYYLHVKAKNDDSSTLATPVLGRTTSNKVPPTMGTPTLSATGAFVAGQRRLSVPYTAVSGSGPAYQIYWYYSSTKPSVSITVDGSGTTSPILDDSGPTSIGRCYIYIRSSATTSTTGTTAPSTTLSDWSDGVSIDISGTRTLTYDDNTTDTTASMPTSPVSGTDPWDGWATTVSANTPTRTGYTFNGWNTSSDGTSGTNYAASAAITLTSNVTLYAKWTANTYTITYNANGSTSGTVPSDQTKTYGTDLTLRTNSGSLAKTDFSFGGWSTNAAGTGTNYAAGGTYSTNAGATLYARWIVPFVTPSWNGTMPAWAASSPFVNGNNFRRNASSLQYGWNNGTFSWSGSTRGTAAADRGWDFYVSETAPASTTTTRTPTNTFQYSTTTSGTQIGTTSFIYRINPTYTSNSVYGSIRPYQYGTDNNKYVRGTQPNGTWSGNI